MKKVTIEEVLSNPETVREGQRFQKPLADFIIENNLQTIVETGSGTSTAFILKALEERGSGKLISIDDEPYCQYEIEHPQYELIRKKSRDAMSDLYFRIGTWDLFLHDSNHDIGCQTYELEMALACVKPLGWIACDDYMWAGHFAWKHFLERHELIEYPIGNIRMTQKTDTFIMPKRAVCDYSNYINTMADIDEEAWVAEGNKLTFYEIYPQTRER